MLSILTLIKILVAGICAGFFINELILVIVKFSKDSFLALDQEVFEQLQRTWPSIQVDANCKQTADFFEM